MTLKAFPELPARGPGLREKASTEQWGVVAKDAIATIHTEPDACEDCLPLDGDTMRLPEAESLLPKHPNCRCWYTWDWRPELMALPAESVVARAFNRLSMTRSTASEAHTHDSSMRTQTTKSGDRFDKRLDVNPTDVKTWTEKRDDGEDARYIRVPISSTSEDRDGDSFSEEGIEDLRDQIINQRKPMFADHGLGDGLFAPRYQGQDITGSWEDAEIEDETVYGITRLNDANPDADWVWEYSQLEMPVGWSIGFIGEDYDHDDEDDSYEFHRSDLVEISSVGIPSNPDGVAAMAAKAAADSGADIDEGTLAQALVSELSSREGVDPPRTRAPTDPASGANETDHPHETKDMDDDTRDLFERVIAVQEDTKEAQSDLETRLDTLEADAGEHEDKNTDPEDDEGDEKDLSNEEVDELRSILDDDTEAKASETTIKDDDDDDDDEDDDEDEDEDDEDDEKGASDEVIEVI